MGSSQSAAAGCGFQVVTLLKTPGLLTKEGGVGKKTQHGAALRHCQDHRVSFPSADADAAGPGIVLLSSEGLGDLSRGSLHPQWARGPGALLAFAEQQWRLRRRSAGSWQGLDKPSPVGRGTPAFPADSGAEWSTESTAGQVLCHSAVFSLQNSDLNKSELGGSYLGEPKD